MVNWEEAGGIAAVVSAMYLPFVLSETAYSVLQASGRVLAGYVWPAKSQCKRMCWDNIPDGRVHDCPTSVGPYYNPNRTCYCGARTLDDVFNKASTSASNPSKLVSKPKQLALDRRYIYTDVMTLLAFTLCSENPPYFGSIRLDNVGDISVARLQETHEPRPDLTKRTIEGLLNGFPPWYRENVEIAHGPVVPHPIRSRDDLYRAGWVVAVGLSNIKPHSFAITQCDFMGQPISRILNKLKDQIRPHFLQDPAIEAAISAIEYMIRSRTGSGVERYLTADLHKGFVTGVTSALSGSACIFAMELFNDVGPLSGQDKDRLVPILKPVVDAAFRGSYIVIQKFKNGKDGFRIPPRLEDLRRPVYLDLGRT
ncbi:MAG: hypothetical protein L6R40_004716 [Gallowayella cf. fulva]|nr:MAG: hypothetical protein L6R40_004716 [Xanthomendoza cf. fulva]